MKEKIKSLQGLRAVAFIVIFISHTSIGNLSKLGAWGVSIFLILSGFVMILSHWNRRDQISLTPKDIVSFAWNKIKKLYPLHIVMMVACILIALYAVFIIHTMTLKKLVIDIFLHTFLLQIWIPNSEYYMTLNGVSWYLCVCVLLYLTFPFVLKCLNWFDKRYKHSMIIPISIILGIVQILIALIAYYYGGCNYNDLWSMQWITYYCPLSRLIDFLIGCSIGYLYLHKNELIEEFRSSSLYIEKKFSLKTKKILINSISLLNMIVILYLWYAVTAGNLVGYEWIEYTLIYTPTTVLTILLACSTITIFNKLLSHKILVFIGDMSGWGFLIHKTVIKYCDFILEYLYVTNSIVIAITAAIMTAIAIFLWKSITKKLEERKLKNSI